MNITLKEFNTLVPIDNTLAKQYRWKTDRDYKLRPSEMATNHLINTLKMIWNNCTAFEKIAPVNLYRFGPHYTEKYMCESVYYLIEELKTRKDLKAYHIKVLKGMNDCLKVTQLEGSVYEY